MTSRAFVEFPLCRRRRYQVNITKHVITFRGGLLASACQDVLQTRKNLHESRSPQEPGMHCTHPTCQSSTASDPPGGGQKQAREVFNPMTAALEEFVCAGKSSGKNNGEAPRKTNSRKGRRLAVSFQLHTTLQETESVGSFLLGSCDVSSKGHNQIGVHKWDNTHVTNRCRPSQVMVPTLFFQERCP